MEKQKYVLAVSGGVDSVAMLHMLAAKQGPDVDYVVAHFDHGIRPDSAHDAEFTAELARKYGFEIEIGEGKLGSDASEALSREKRYDFLRVVAKKHNAEKIVTAHHQDDVLETMIINLIRGTGPRGLMPMLVPSDVLRPMLNKSKAEIIDYAKLHNLKWREDSTNQNEDYLRNYVRKNFLPKIEPHKQKLLNMRERLGEIYTEVDMLIRLATPRMNMLHRPSFVALPYGVQREVVRAWMLSLGTENIDRKMLERIVISIKTMRIGKKTDLNNELWLASEPGNVILSKK